MNQALARRAYELGRLRTSLVRAAVVAAVAGVVGVASFGVSALPWLALPLAAGVLALYRGGALQAGFLRGSIAGIVGLLLPLSLLRPCCAAGAAGASCCAAPSMCSVFGLLLGGGFALLLPRVTGARRVEAAVGLLVGVVTVGAMRCEAMLLGEIVGFLGGAAAGLVALGIARALVEPAPQR